MSDLAQRIRNARVFKWEFAQGKYLKLRRPTDVEAEAMADTVHVLAEAAKADDSVENVKVDSVDLSLKYLDGWENINESDLFAGGSDSSVQFDIDAAKEWLLDRRDIALRILTALLSRYTEFKEQVAEARKN